MSKYGESRKKLFDSRDPQKPENCQFLHFGFCADWINDLLHVN